MLQVQSIEIMFSPSLPELAREEKKKQQQNKEKLLPDSPETSLLHNSIFE